MNPILKHTYEEPNGKPVCVLGWGYASVRARMLISAFDSCSYMDTEQYEEAVRDYEKVYQTEKTKGRWADLSFSVQRIKLGSTKTSKA